MKKIISFVLSVSLAAALFAGCSSKDPAVAPSTDPASGTAKLKIGIVQIVEHPSLDEIRTAFLTELEALGYKDKVEILYENAQNEMTNVTSICQKFVGESVDMIVAIATPSAQGAAAAVKGTDIPVLFSAVTDPLAAELVESLEKPTGNITGTSDAIPIDRIFALAKELTPNAKTFGFIYNLGEINSVSVINQAKEYCEANGLNYIESTVTNTGEVQQAAQALADKADAIFTPIDNTVASSMAVLSKVALDNKIPVYTGADSMVNDGGLATVGINYTNLGKQTAKMAAEILSGKPISEIPVSVLDDMNVYVNAETANALGIDVSKYSK